MSPCARSVADRRSGNDQRERVGLVHHLDALGLTEAIAVDLPGERVVGGDGEPIDVGPLRDGGTLQSGLAPK